jgi:hypothetical protein
MAQSTSQKCSELSVQRTRDDRNIPGASALFFYRDSDLIDVEIGTDMWKTRLATANSRTPPWLA